MDSSTTLHTSHTKDNTPWNPKKIKEVLENHLQWVADKTTGQRADLSGADLSGADLSCADLSCANLSCADFSGATLRSANLRSATLSGAVLDESIYQIARIGLENRMTTYNHTKDIVWCGCFTGTMAQWIERIKIAHQIGNKHRDAYLAAALYFQTVAGIYAKKEGEE